MLTPSIQRKVSYWENAVRTREQNKTCPICNETIKKDCGCVEKIGHEILKEMLDKRFGE